MATGSYRLTAVLAFLVVAGTTAAGWRGGHPPGGGGARVLPRPPAGQVTGRAAAAGLPAPHPRATPDATGSPALSSRARRSCPAVASACGHLRAHPSSLPSGR